MKGKALLLLVFFTIFTQTYTVPLEKTSFLTDPRMKHPGSPPFRMPLAHAPKKGTASGYAPVL